MGHAPLLGRGTELAALRRLSRHAAVGYPTTAVVSGAAGMGKSALLDAFTATVVAGHRVIRFSGDETEQDLPYATLSALLGGASTGWENPFAAGADALRTLGDWCDRGPVICVVDDADYCDSESLTALNFMMRRMESDPLMLVLGIRPEGASRLPPTLAGASRIGEWITLSGLTVSAVRDLSEALGTPKLSWHAASRVQAHTNGNPLHLRTLINEVPVDVLEDVTRPIPAPASLGQLVVNELSGLSPGAQRVAAAAAVLGDRPLVNALVTVAGVTVEEARDACEELTRAGILRVAPGGARAEFTHPAMRSAVYDDLGPTARATLHTRAARISTGAEAVQHRVQAAFGPDPALAADLERDAQDSVVHGRLLTGARALLQAARLSLPGEDADRRLLAGVEALLMSGDVGAARAQAPALETLPRTGRRLAVEARIAWLSGDATRAIRLGREAWALGDGLDEQALGALAGLLAHIELLCDNGDDAARWATQALARERLDPAATSHIRAVHYIALGVRGRAEEALRLLADMPDDPTQVPLRRHPELAARGNLRTETGRLTEAEADLAVSSSLRYGDLAPFRLNASADHAQTLFRCGRWDAAQQTVEHVLNLAEDMGQVWLTGYFHAVASHVPVARGDWQRAQHHIEAAERVAEESQVQASRVFAADAAVHLAAQRGDPHALLDAADWLRRLPIDAPAHQPGLLSWPVHVVTALVALGRLDEAEIELESHHRLARDQDNRPGLFSAAWLTGVLAAARRDNARARAGFEQSLAMSDDHVQTLEQILARHHYGRFLRRRGERRKAVEVLHEARARAVAVGATPLARRCEEELAAAGALPTGPVPPAAPTLTPQEQVIASLVCEGHTNRQIAANLVLSPKTVSYHLANVYAKLGVHSRLQLAQALRQQP